MEVIYFFEVKTKYISLSVLKTLEFSRVRSTSENLYVFNSHSENIIQLLTIVLLDMT